MPKNARKKQVKILDIVNEILKFNEKSQQGQGPKILTANQMLSKLPISLAHLKAGDNSEKLKNEKRQLLYSLCHYIILFIGNKNIKTNTFRVQASNSIMYGYFGIGFIDFIFENKRFTDFTSLFFPYDFQKMIA